MTNHKPNHANKAKKLSPAQSLLSVIGQFTLKDDDGGLVVFGSLCILVFSCCSSSLFLVSDQSYPLGDTHFKIYRNNILMGTF